MKCETCGKKFDDLETALDHVQKKHGMTDKQRKAEEKLHR